MIIIQIPQVIDAYYSKLIYWIKIKRNAGVDTRSNAYVICFADEAMFLEFKQYFDL